MIQPPPVDELWRDLAADSEPTAKSALSATLAEVRKQQGRRRTKRIVLATSLVAIPLALAAMAWQFGPITTQRVANHQASQSSPQEIQTTETKTTAKKRPRGKLIVVEEPATVLPEWNVVELTDEELLAALPVPAKLVDTPSGKELIFPKEEPKTIPTVPPNPRRLPLARAGSQRAERSITQ
jgi:hypothetical protein